MAKEVFFEAGKRYRNRQDWYEVLEIQGKQMKVRYESDGSENMLDMDMQKRIVENMGSEENKSINITQGKNYGIINYRLSLQDTNDSVNLIQEKHAIQSVFNDILQGGPTGNAFKEVSSIEIIEMKNHSMVISVNETATKWHAWVGKKLANDHGARHLCLSAPEKMFDWEVI